MTFYLAILSPHWTNILKCSGFLLGDGIYEEDKSENKDSGSEIYIGNIYVAKMEKEFCQHRRMGFLFHIRATKSVAIRK